MASRRPPPGGHSTFSFGNVDGAKKEKSPAPSPQQSMADVTGGLSPGQLDTIRGLMNSSTDVGELVKKMQTEMLGAPESGLNPTGSRYVSDQKVQEAMDALHSALAARGTDTLVRLGKKFHIMDDDANKGLCFGEFKKGLTDSGVKLSEPHLQALFRHFDSDCSGYVSFDEFLVGVRPEMNPFRRGLVMQAFEAMDENGDGALTVQDVTGKYDCSMHPDVVAGSRTEVEVLQSFMSGFDGSLGPKSAVVTPEKFLAYYTNVSASVDDDEYFALMMHNVWHLPGADTTRRLLVTHEDGTQTVEEVENDYEISKEDLQEIKAKLIEQGIPVVKVALYGYVEANPANVLSSSTSPKKTASPAGKKTSTPGDVEPEPEQVVAAYKQRMSTSNVSFA